MTSESGGHGAVINREDAFATRAARVVAFAGFVLYAAAAPHSIAGAWVGLSLVAAAWLVRLFATREPGVRPTSFDFPLWLLYAWTVLSAFLSYEPRVSIAKLASVGTFLVFYLTQSMLTRRMATAAAVVLIASGVAGTLWSLGEVARGRGVVIAEMKDGSPLRQVADLREGDAIWRVNEGRVSSVEEIDEAIRRTPTGEGVRLSVVARGEHVEWPGFVATDELKGRASPSGLTGGGPTRRFRASGWTRHYETYAEVLQMVAQLALGLALAGLLRGRRGAAAWLPFAAFVLLGAGIALTAMRTTLAAFAVGGRRRGGARACSSWRLSLSRSRSARSSCGARAPEGRSR
jgi:hypothetical protein